MPSGGRRPFWPRWCSSRGPHYTRCHPAGLQAALGASAAWALLLAQLEQEMLADTSAATLSIIIPVRCSRRWSGVHG